MTSIATLSNKLTFTGMLTQTRAMLVDAYRELNSKKLFWITLVLSGILVAAFATVGFNETGFSIMGKVFRHPFVNTLFLPKVQLYKNLFIDFGVNLWLGYFGIILALVSTAQLFPDFMSNGAVDLYLARPLGRTRLFLTKYLAGLLFVTFQVSVFCAASFLVIGFRADAWVPGIFLAVPVVVLMFSYLWCICAFIGTLTRSTIAALLVTMLIWFVIFGIHIAESRLLIFSTFSTIEADEIQKDIVKYESDIKALQAQIDANSSQANDAGRLKILQSNLDRVKSVQVTNPYQSWHGLLYAIKWPLPKTTETTNLMERWLDKQFRDHSDRADRPERESNNPESALSFFQNGKVRRMAMAEVDKIMRARSATWVIGTSLLFEAFMLGFTAWIFSRRDY